MVKKSEKTEYGANLEFKNHTKEIFYWGTEDDLYFHLEPDPGTPTKLADDFSGVILEEDNLEPVAALETKILDPNDITTSAAANSGIKNITGVYYDSNTTTNILQ